MSSLTATYNSPNTTQIIEVPHESDKSLTESILDLKDKINVYLTNVMENEKEGVKVTTVDEDEVEKMKAEEEVGDDDEDKESNEENTKAADRSGTEDKQNVKKQKTSS